MLTRYNQLTQKQKLIFDGITLKDSRIRLNYHSFSKMEYEKEITVKFGKRNFGNTYSDFGKFTISKNDVNQFQVWHSTRSISNLLFEDSKLDKIAFYLLTNYTTRELS